MSLYLKNLEDREKCKLLERLDMSKDEDYSRAEQLLKLVDFENFLLEPGYYERNPNDVLFFLWDPQNKKICGFMEITYLKDMEGVVDAITLQILTSRSFKDSSYRSERIGNILMDALFEEAKSDPRINFITIESVAFYWDAHKFYQKMGFKFVGKTKRPLMIIRKKPSFNRFLYLDGNYPESSGWGKEDVLSKLPEIYDTINKEYDPEGKYTEFYKEKDYIGMIYCRNFQKEGYNLMISYLYDKIGKNDIDKNIKKLITNYNIYSSLISKSIINKDYNIYKKILDIGLEYADDKHNIILPGSPDYNLEDLLRKFGTENVIDLFLNIFPKNISKLRFVIDVHISHPFSDKIDELYSRRFDAKSLEEKLDLNMFILALYFYNNKEMVDKIVNFIKNQEIKKEVISVLKK